MSGHNYDEEAAIAAALKASMMTVEEDDKRRKQKYGHLYTTMIPPVQASNIAGSTASSRSLTGSPVTVTGCIPSDPNLSNSQPSLKNLGRTNSNPTQCSIARPRPQSLKGKGGNSTSASLYPSVPSTGCSVSPDMPPRPDVAQSKLPPPPLPTTGPNARGGVILQNTGQRLANVVPIGNNTAILLRGATIPQNPTVSNLGVNEPLIKLSPPIYTNNDPLGFDINSLDPLNFQGNSAQGQVQPSGGAIGFEAWGAQGASAVLVSANEALSNPLYGANTNPFQSNAGVNYYGGNGAQQYVGQLQGGTLQRNTNSSSGTNKFGAGSYNTIQTTRGVNNMGPSLGANVAGLQGGIAQRGPSPSFESGATGGAAGGGTVLAGATGGQAQHQQVQSPASSHSSQDPSQMDKHLSELSDLMDFSIDENDDFMTLGSFDPLESVDQPLALAEADVNLSFFAEPSPENAMPVPGPVTRSAASTSQAAGFTLPLTKAVAVSDKYAAFRQPSPINAIKSPEEEHYEKLTLMKINEMVKSTPSPVATPSSDVAVDEGSLQDPFSIEALTRELEEKRARYAEEQAARQALLRRNNAQERARQERMEQLRAQEEELQRKCFKRNSHMVKGQESRYEMLHHVRETADEEIQTFCQMVSRLKKQFSHDDPVTNKGLVISPRMRHGTNQNMTVKVDVVTKYCSEPIIFTCDLNASVEHVISHVILSLTDDLGSTSVDDFILKVHGQSEFFLNTAVLGDYEYVQSCLKLDKDIKLNLYRLCDIPRSLLRTAEDDRQPVFVPKPREVDGEIKVTRDKLNILMETFYKEVERLRDQALQMGCGKVHCHAVVQTVKAICATLNRVETFEIIKAVKRLRSITLERTLHPASPADRDAFVYITSEGESVGSVVDSEIKRLAEMDDLHRAMEDVTKAVKNLIELYCRTYHTDFRFESVTNVVKDKVSLIDVPENLIVHIASAHRIPPKWFQKFDDFRVICGLYHGGRRLSQEVITKIKPAHSDGFQDTIIWDEWIQFPNVMLCLLPREARLCFTLIGVRIYTAEQGQKVSHVNTPLGWVALQVFNHKFECAQGSQLLGLWVGESANPIGTSQSNTESPNTVLLQVNLPDFDCDIVFPTVMEPGESMQQDFRALHPTDQENLQFILNKDSITRLSAPELEFLWEKRNFLYNHPDALAKVLKAVPRWDFLSLQEIYTMIQDWSPLNPIQAMELLLSGFPDSHVRTKAIHWIRHLTNDELCDYLPQLVQALKFESYHNSSLARFLLERSVLSIRLAHQLYWLLKEVAENMRYRKRYQLLFGALLSVVGSALRHEFSKQEDLTRMLAAIAEKVKAARDKDAVLQRELENMWEFMQQDESIRLPINPSMEIMGVDAKSCSYFTSNAFPLKLVLKNIDSTAEPMYSMFKVGDDLRQDMITMQLVRVMDKMWLKHGLDLKILTFRCQATGPKRGLVEIITESETLRKIQVKHGHGLAGSFKDRPIAEWLQMQNPTELEYQKAVDNFIASCAGYCVATYVLGIGDRHNDNIMIKQSGHMFHIDFGKFLGDAQMFGNIKRDRVPFVLTSDMAYVINGGGKSSHKFQLFVDLCCQAFNILRNHSSLFLNLFSLMSNSGIPGLNENAAKYVQKSLMPELDDSEATAEFTKMIHDSLKSYTTQINFFIHNLAQRKFSGHQEGAILSFAPKVYSLQTDGRITNVEVFGYQKRYNPEKYYIYIIKVDREKQKVPTFVFRRYSEIQELHHKLVVMFPLARLPSLPGKVLIGRTHVKTVAEARKGEVEKFLKQIVSLANEVSECDLVYTFFHPMLRDEQDIDKTNLQKLKDEPRERSTSRTIGGQVKLSILYKNDTLTVMVMHVKNLCGQSGDAPDPYVKTYLLPDPVKLTKRKTKIAKETFHPTYNEMLLYRLPLEEVRGRTLQVTVWNYNTLEENEFLGAMHLRIAELDLTKETTGWFPLQTLHKITTS